MNGLRASTGNSPMQLFRRILVVSLAVGAILIGLLALHTIAGSHGGLPAVTSEATVHAHADHGSMTSAVAVAAAPSSQTAGTLPTLSCDLSCTTGCVMLAMACLVLFVLASIVFLARYPAVFHRLMDSGRRLIQQIPESKNHIYLPSLSVLSISRT